MKGTHSLTII